VLSADSPTAPPVGSELIVRFTVKDRDGTYTAFNVYADVTLPSGFSVTHTTSDRGPGCSSGAPGLVCNLDFVQPGSDGHVVIWGTVTQAGPLTFSVHTRHFGEEGNPADDTATLTVQPAGQPTTGGASGGGAGSPPKAVTPPVVVGSVTIGSTLRILPPTWSATPTSVVYQWQLCTATSCKPIRGAKSTRLKLTPPEAGKSVRLVATAKIAGTTVTAVSKRVTIRKRA